MISLLGSETLMTGIRVIEKVDWSIHLIRGQRVMLDSDLANIYGTSTMRLNQAVQRNRKRFPDDFAFQLEREEFANLISQSVISSSHGGRRKLPWAFTEHGAVMLASVLNSETAIDASIRVVRAFIHLREIISADAELARQFAALEKRLDTNDEQIAHLFAAIRQLLAPTPAKKRDWFSYSRKRVALPNEEKGLTNG